MLAFRVYFRSHIVVTPPPPVPSRRPALAGDETLGGSGWGEGFEERSVVPNFNSIRIPLIRLSGK